MHIACTANSNYLPHAAAMLHSLLSLHADQRPTVHFLHDEALATDELSRLGDFVTGMHATWRSYPITREQWQGFPHSWRFSHEAWFRALLPQVLQDVERVLYLDADTIIRRPLNDLWNTDLGGATVGAVANPLYPFQDDTFLHELGLESDADYFNSGMLLMDLARWREQELNHALYEFVATHGAAQHWPDQNTLNAILRGRWLSLSPTWNAQNVYFDLNASQLPCSAAQTHEAQNNPAIVHYVAPYKPWDYLCKHRFRDDYFRHLAATPWRTVQIQGITWKNRLLRLLPQPFMWLMLRHLREGRRALRSMLG